VVRATFEGRCFSALAALFAVAALAVGENLVFLLACLVFGCAQAARWPAARNLAGVRVRRVTPARARVGAATPIVYRFEARGGRPAIGVRLADAGGPLRPGTVVVEAPAVGEAPLETTVARVFTRRGRHRLGPLRVASRFPLGLFEVRRAVPAPDEVLVRPSRGRATPALLARLAGPALARTRPSLRQRGTDVFHGIREFREGDDPRRIHWRTSARRGAPTVAQWRRDEGRRLVIVLGRGRGAGASGLRAFERAVSLAATLWETAHARGLTASLELGTGTRPRSRGAGLDALAVVRAQAGRRPRRALRRLARDRAPKVVVYVATGSEPGIENRLGRAAGAGGRTLFVRADRDEARRWVRGLPWSA
jgi:uncharacterized protein (DUF58 family)